MKKYFLAISTFAGTIIGVGLFGLPYATAQVGLAPMIVYFIVLGGVMLIVNLALGEICLRTNEQHRLPGYAQIYLGKTAKYISVTSGLVGLCIGMVAYIVIGGTFLFNILGPIFGGSEFTYALIIFASASTIIFLGSRTIAKSELFSLAVFFGVLAWLFFKGMPFIQTTNFTSISLDNIFLPYGIVLFALAGTSIIPETREMLIGKDRQLKSVLTVGTLIPIITYLIFIILVFGVSGSNTSEDALSGLIPVLGNDILLAGFLFGLITTFTSYISIGLTLKKTLWYDFKFSHFKAWLVAISIPLLLFLGGFNDFILIAAFSGAVTMGLDSIMIFLIYLKAKRKGERMPEYRLNIPKFGIYVIIAMLLAGAVLGLMPS